MAVRPVFVPVSKAPYVTKFMGEFTWNGGFAVSQKQKNIAALHEAFHKRFPDDKVLEISSKSMQELGIQLSAFHLKKEVPSLGKKYRWSVCSREERFFLKAALSPIYTWLPPETPSGISV